MSGEIMGVAVVALQAILFYGLLAVVIWKLSRIESQTKQLRRMMEDLQKAMLERR